MRIKPVAGRTDSLHTSPPTAFVVNHSMSHLSSEPDPASGATPPSPALGEQLLARAQALKQAANAGKPPLPLKGKYFGLVSEQPDSEAALLFTAAAAGLGAQVAQIRPSVARLGADDDIEQAALWMGRLYDAIECQGVAAGVVRRMRAAAGVPVFDGMACDNPTAAAWASRLDGLDTDADGRRYLLQAALLALVD
jgi:ornithine carbamoyltransferase